jgi:alpha-galactosidase
MAFFDIMRPPDGVRATVGGRALPLERRGETWEGGGVTVTAGVNEGRLAVDVTAAGVPLDRVRLRWRASLPNGTRFLGDAWERGYGDLEWRGLVPERVMPWYFLAHDAAPEGGATHGYGVRTGAASLSFWTVDGEGVSLWLDVRAGGAGVELGGRSLRAAEVVARRGGEDETPFAAARAFCHLLCDDPRLPYHAVYGGNNWYYAYGNSDREAILDDTKLLVSLAPDSDNRPYMVIDAGWQARADESVVAGSPWDRANDRFGDMASLASAMRDAGARPGIWIRPLAAAPDDPDSILLPAERAEDKSAKIKILDPSIPEVRARVRDDFRCLRDWGYELIKHDWSTCDLLGRWGHRMGAELTNPGWTFADLSRTTAEIVLDLFGAIREGAGDAIVIGCNTLGHLAAGLFELQRTGDDTSGCQWERTRRMGVNTLAFRMPQHAALFAVDADCVGLTREIPWDRNRQWLDLLARSGTPLFVSADPKSVGSLKSEQAEALRRAYALAAEPQPVAEPLDWMDTTCPRAWKLGDDEACFDWSGAEGVDPVL